MDHSRSTMWHSALAILEYFSRSFIAMILFAVFAFPPVNCAQTSRLTLASPHGTLAASFSVDSIGVPRYWIDSGKANLLLPSRLGLEPSWTKGFVVASSGRSEHRGAWKPLYGERASMPDNYNQLTVKLAQKGGAQIVVQFRAYDEGVALRYGTEQPIEVSKELTEFHWPAHSFAYEEHGTEGEYSRNPVSKIAPLCQTPLTVELANGTYAALLEAANVDFPQMTIASVPKVDDTLIAELGGPGTLFAGSFTPWRLLMFAKTPGELLEHNYLELNLNAKQEFDNVEWIKPGIAMREVTLSTDGAHKLIDFAADHHIRYIGFDGGWYGSEDYETGDATHERTRDGRGQPVSPLSIQESVRYAKEHGVGVFIYIDHKQAEKQRDTLFPLYEKWGVAGVKIGFVYVGTQQNTAWITETVRRAAEHHLTLDIHDSYRPTGYTRAYPNLLTVEGIRGNEHFPTAEHDATLPFTRYLAGSADYTICYYTPRLTNTHAHQLAMSIISYSPLQWIFWYDKPSDYHGEPEISWFEHLPTVWDDTRVVDGKIGKFAIIARQSGNDWFVGVVNGNSQRKVEVALSFLVPGERYEAEIYSDNSDINTPTQVAIHKQDVTSKTVLPTNLLPSGGLALRIRQIRLPTRP